MLRLETEEGKKNDLEEGSRVPFDFAYTEPEVLRDKQVHMLGEQLNVWILYLYGALNWRLQSC